MYVEVMLVSMQGSAMAALVAIGSHRLLHPGSSQWLPVRAGSACSSGQRAARPTSTLFARETSLTREASA